MKQGDDWGIYTSWTHLPGIGLARIHGRCVHDGRVVGVWARAFGHGVWFAPGLVEAVTAYELSHPGQPKCDCYGIRDSRR